MKIHVEVAKLHNPDLPLMKRFIWIGRQWERIVHRGELPSEADWTRWGVAMQSPSAQATSMMVSVLSAMLTVRRAAYKGKQAAWALRGKP